MPSNQRAFVSDADVPTRLLDLELESQQAPENQIVFRLDAGGNFRFVNSAGERLCGYTRQELGRMHFSQVVEPQFCNYLTQQVRRNIRQRFGTVYEVEVRTKQGQRVSLETSIHLVRDGAHAIEIHGIALSPQTTEKTPNPRCLDERFAYSVF